jgi:hypothetical protein
MLRNRPWLRSGLVRPIGPFYWVGRPGHKFVAQVRLLSSSELFPRLLEMEPCLLTEERWRMANLHLSIQGDEDNGITIRIRGFCKDWRNQLELRVEEFAPVTRMEVYEKLLNMLHCFDLVGGNFDARYLDIKNSLGMVMAVEALKAVRAWSVDLPRLGQFLITVRQDSEQIVKKTFNGKYWYSAVEQEDAEDLLDKMESVLRVDNDCSLCFETINKRFYTGDVLSFEAAVRHFDDYMCQQQWQLSEIVRNLRCEALLMAFIPRLGKDSWLYKLPLELLKVIMLTGKKARMGLLDVYLSRVRIGDGGVLALKGPYLHPGRPSAPSTGCIALGWSESVMRDVFPHDTLGMNRTCKRTGKGADETYYYDGTQGSAFELVSLGRYNIPHTNS